MNPKRVLRRVALTGTLVASVAFAAMAMANDVVFPDGDYSSNGPNLGIGGSGRPCTDLGSAIRGSVGVSFNGGTNASHFLPGEALDVTLTPSDPKITASVVGANPSVPLTWGSGQQDEFSIPIDTTVDPSIGDGTYHVDVLVHGQTSGYDAGDGPSSPGRPKYIVSVTCAPTGTTNHAPSVVVATDPVAVDEHTQAADSGTYADADGDPVSLSASYGTVTKDANGPGTWAWSATPDDGPSNSQSVTITATDSHTATGSASFQLNVTNVPPTVTALTPNVSQVLVGSPVTFAGAATDPSTADTLAGFSWSFNNGGYGVAGANTFTTTFTSCGSNTVSARARDKDNGISDPFTSTAVSALNGHYLPPLNEGIFNAVQKGQVVPVKINVSCAGANLTGLTPKIQLLSGELDPVTDPGDGTLNVTTASVSNADTTGQMRAIDGGYIYNLAVPSASAGAMFTIRVQPFGTAGGGSMYVVIKIRK